MKKYKRSQIRRGSPESKIIRYMRMSRGIPMRAAGRLIGASDSLISHLETGRLDLSPARITQLVEAYGYTMEEFEEYQAGKPIPVLSIKDECIGLLDRLDDTKLRAVHAVLVSFVS